MKMKPEHYEKLRDSISAILAEKPDSASKYQSAGLSHKRFRWDCVWAMPRDIRQPWFDEVYKYCHDEHIDTALRAIVPPYPNNPP